MSTRKNAKSKANKPLTLLGNSGTRFPEKPSVDILEVFVNRSSHRDYIINFDTEDFTSMCPVTGQPDFATISISYIPDEKCIETKSLKFYLASYRSTQSFNEEIVNSILDDLVKACDPREMLVEGVFSARGGIQVSVTASRSQEDDDDSDIPF